VTMPKIVAITVKNTLFILFHTFLISLLQPIVAMRIQTCNDKQYELIKKQTHFIIIDN
jgi:hypothetical protein